MKTDPIAAQLESACDRIVAGKQAAREIAGLVSPFKIKEPEFRLLWCLRSAHALLDQRQLAKGLVLSPAQVCALVEKLDRAGLIAREIAPDDRRRSLWRISEGGRKLLTEIQNLYGITSCNGCGTEATSRRVSA